MAITITLDEATSARAQSVPLAELTRWVQEYLRQRLPESETNGFVTTGTNAAPEADYDEDHYESESVSLNEPWDEETILAVQESAREMKETGITYSQEEVDTHVMSALAAWKAKRHK